MSDEMNDSGGVHRLQYFFADILRAADQPELLSGGCKGRQVPPMGIRSFLERLFRTPQIPEKQMGFRLGCRHIKRIFSAFGIRFRHSPEGC